MDKLVDTIYALCGEFVNDPGRARDQSRKRSPDFVVSRETVRNLVTMTQNGRDLQQGHVHDSEEGIQVRVQAFESVPKLTCL
jgi:hypothetical protein